MTDLFEKSTIHHQELELFSTILDHNTNAIGVTTLEGELIYRNKAFQEYFPYTDETNIQPLFPITFARINFDKIKTELEAQDDPIHFVETNLQNNAWSHLTVTLTSVGPVQYFIFNIDHMLSPEREGVRVNMQLEKIIDQLPVLVSHIDNNDKFIFANHAYTEFFQCTLDDIIGYAMQDFLGAEIYDPNKHFISRVKTGETVEFDVSIFKGSDLRMLQVRLIPGESFFGDYYIFAQDVTELRTFQKKLEYRAYHDSLTDLTNRTYFLNDLEKKCKVKANDVGLLFIDVDGLKNANDKYGHDCGDKLLKDFAKQLKSLLRPSDNLSRLAGDEFTVLLSGLNEPLNDLHDICQRIQERLPSTMTINNHTIPCSCSIGATYIDPHIDYTVEQWLSIADSAMYRVKHHGKGSYNVEIVSPPNSANVEE